MLRRFSASLLVLLLVFIVRSQAQTTLSYPALSAGADDRPGATQDQVRDRVPARDNIIKLPLQGETPVPGTLVYPPYPARPEPPSEFQQFVAGSIGRNLPMFGYNLFGDVPSTFAPVDRVPVTPDYVIGPGDELVIRAWGQIDLDAHVVVDRSGAIYLPKVGTLSVAGLRFEQLQGFLKSSIGKIFKNFDMTVNLGQLRSIQVFVVGQARRPGTYTVSSLSTLVNALFASGGPSTKGSMRHIQVKRDNKVVTDLDVYDLLLKGDKSRDVTLLPGDIIFIPPIGPQVALAGSVNVPAIYELKGDTTLDNGLQMASGLTNVADGQKVRVERIDNHTTRRVDEFSLDDGGRNRHLKDGDLVYVVPLSPRFENAVTLRGNVAIPGRYPWHAGMRVRDLIPSREALVTREYWLKHNLSARDIAGASSPWRSESDVTWKPGSDADASWKPSTGKANSRGSDVFVDGQRDASASAKGRGQEREVAATIRNEVQRNAPEINWDYAVIQRLDPKDLSTHLLAFNLGKAIVDGDNQDNLELHAGDIITIFSQADLRVPVQEQSKFVYLEGEFNSAGVYKVRPGETLRDLVKRAGGITSQAYLFGAEFTRESTREEQEKNLAKFIQQMERSVDVMGGSAAANATTADEAAALKTKLEEQRVAIAKLRHLRPTGRIVLELRPWSGSIDDLPALTLEDGDRFYVPYRTSEVNVAGEVYNSSSFIYDQRKRVNDYLRQAGGTTRFADTRHMFLLRADGSVVPRSKGKGWWGNNTFENVKLMPGDSIVVPQHIAVGTVKQVKDWTQIFTQFALGAAAINVLK